jgi:molybdopterin-guanine dinucleotide biosynthesis protein A
MGSDKGLLEIRGTKMIELVVKTLKPVVSDILIISENSKYKYLGYPVLPDLIAGRGPSGGICTGLQHSSTEKNIVLSCDTPNISTVFLEFLISNAGLAEITVPVSHKQIQCLCGIYSKSILPKLNDYMAGGERKMTELLKRFQVNYLDICLQKQFDTTFLFRNINTPEDLEKENNTQLS